MKITIKLSIKIASSFLLTTALVSMLVAYYVPLLVKSHISEEVLLEMILMIVVVPMAALGLLLVIFILHPIKNLGKAARHITKGNFDFKVYSGKFSRETINKVDELSQIVMGFKAMRRKFSSSRASSGSR